MPEPVSAISATTRSSSTRVDTSSQPPLGIASRAFRNRFRNTCCSWCSMPDDRDRRLGELAPNLDAADLELMLEQREDVGDDGVQVDAASARSTAALAATD